MKILHILHVPPPVHGSSLVGQSIKNSKVINDTFICKYINLSTSRTVDEIGKNPLSKIGRYFSILSQIFWQLIVFRPKVCYITISVGDNGFYKDVFVTILAGLFGAKKVYHLHNKGVKNRQDNWINDKLYRLVFHKAEVILLSEYLYSDIEKYVPKNRVHYCANGIKEEVVNSKQQAVSSEEKVGSSELVVGSEENIEETQTPSINYRLQTIDYKLPTILFLSNLIVSKGVYVLLEACKLLQEKEIPFHCTLVGGEGDISTTELNQKIKELGLSNEVNYAGRQYGKDKEAYLNRADIFTLPTFYPNECMPLVLIEAMQQSLAIVSTTEGAIPGMVLDGENGFLVAPKDAKALAEKLELLIGQPELRKKMGIEGRKKYEQEYTLKKFETRFCEILNSTMQ